MYVRTDGQRWEVESLYGGPQGGSTTHRYNDEPSALARVEQWLDAPGTWREFRPTTAGPRDGSAHLDDSINLGHDLRAG